MYGAFPVENEVIETIILNSPESSDIWAGISSIAGLLAMGSLVLLSLTLDGENDNIILTLMLITSILGLFAFISGIYSVIKSKKRWQTIVLASIGILFSIIPVLIALNLIKVVLLNIF
tara:strand:+ start:292 stop:645 length:354 start_codon:yes stop_codon:yes gene_type:complete